MKVPWINKSITYIIALLLLLMPLIYLHDLRDPSSLPRFALSGVIAGLLIFLVLLDIHYKKILATSLTHILISSFLVFAWLSYFWSMDSKNSTIELLQLTANIFICFSAAYAVKKNSLFSLILASVLGATIASGIGIAQYFNFNPFNYYQFIVPASSFTNTNFVATYIDLIIPVAFILIFLSVSKKQLLASSVSFSICLTFILISHNRGSWLGLSFALIIFIFLLYSNKNIRKLFFTNLKIKSPYLLLSILIPVIILSLPTPQLETPRKTSELRIDNSAKIRLNIYINSLDIISDYPLYGTGYGSFRQAFRKYIFSTVPLTVMNEDVSLLRAHSDSLQMFVELGFIGGILFLLIYVLSLKNCWKIFTSNKAPIVLLITIGLFLALIASMVHSLVDYPLRKPSSAIQFWCWIGLILGLTAKKINLNSQVTKYKIILLFALSGLVFSVYSANFYYDYIQASKFRLQTKNALKLNNCQSAKINADKMMQLFDADYLHVQLFTLVYSRCPFSNSIKFAAMQRTLFRDPTNTRALITQGKIYLQNNKLNKARANFREVTRILPHRASGYIGLAYIELSEQNLTNTVILLSYALELESKNTAALNLMSRVKSKLRDNKSSP